MARICLLGPNQLGSNPRLVRNADCLAAAGHDVTVIYPDHLPRFRAHDRDIASRSAWRSHPLDFCQSPLGLLRGRFARVRRRLAQGINRPAHPFWLRRAYGYFGPELASAATGVAADFYLAQQQMTVLPAAYAASRRCAPFAVDVEDLIADCTDEPADLVATIERKFYPAAAFVTTMSAAAADRIVEQHRLRRAPVVLHNCMALSERAGLLPPDERPAAGPLSLYWFGQTIGPHSCADAILRAIALLNFPARLVLRGANPQGEYIAGLHALAAELGLRDRLAIMPGADPREMVALAAAHAICLGTQPGRQLFHQLAIGNKVFTGMMAGCAVGLSATTAHRRLLAADAGWAFLFEIDSPADLAAQLTTFAQEPARLANLRRRAWDLAGTTYNWDRESPHLVAAVHELFSAPPP